MWLIDKFNNFAYDKEIEKKEQYALTSYASVMEKSVIYGTIKGMPEDVKETENKYIRLREKYKHNRLKSLQIITDWCDYLDYTDECKYDLEMLDVCTAEESHIYYEDIDKNRMKSIEIQKRFDKMLAE